MFGKKTSMATKAASQNAKLFERARAFHASKQFSQAIKGYEKIIKAAPNFAPAHYNLALIRQSEGAFDAAAKLFRKVLKINPNHTQAYFELARCKKYDAGDPYIAELEAATRSHQIDDDGKALLHFALAKIHEDIKDTDQAFAHSRMANELRDAHFNKADHEAFISRLIATFSKRFFDDRKPQGGGRDAHIFIVGMPRSGTTLVDQIISSHPNVHAAGELTFFHNVADAIAKRLGTGQPYPECVTGISVQDAHHFSKIYQDNFTKLPAGISRITNKFPENFRVLGLIALLFPNSRIVHCERDPMDIGLSCYFQNLPVGNHGYSSDLGNIGFYYRQYQRLMDHWHNVLPTPMLRVRYEDMVQDQEAKSRELVEFLGLDWDDACLEFQKSKTRVRTESVWQIRQPIYTSSIERWRRYEKHLTPLIQALKGEDLEPAAAEKNNASEQIAAKESKVSEPLDQAKTPVSDPGQSKVAVWYNPEGFRTKGTEKILGRQVAGEAFLRALVQDPAFSELHACSTTAQSYEDFQKFAKEAGAADKPTFWSRPGDYNKLVDIGTVFYPSPNIDALAWQRRRFDQRGYSVCGVFHTTASDRIMDGINRFLTSPLQSWDAVICTTASMKTMVEVVIEEWTDYLTDRIGAKPSLEVQLPVIPLGVDCSAFTPDAGRRKKFRRKLKIADDDICVLFVGRLAYHAKANPFPMYVALERVFQETGKRIHLVQAGWFANDSIKRAFTESAKRFAPNVRHHFLDGRKEWVRTDTWQGADIFTSLSDNIQETFGITPIEAMAAGLPQVVTDWDGYRNTVRPGIDGFSVPTAQAMPGTGLPMAMHHEDAVLTYDRYIGAASQYAVADIDATTDAFMQLVKDAGLRRKMGDAGLAHARDTFDWPVILGQYRSLWAELAERRKSAEEIVPRGNRPANPMRQDPFKLYADYPTRHIDFNTKVIRTPDVEAIDRKAIFKSPLMNLEPQYRGGNDFGMRVYEELGEQEATIGEISKKYEGQEVLVLRTIAWLAKSGLATLLPID